MATGRLSTTGQHDWLAINLTADQAYLFTVTGLTNDASIAVGSADVLSGEGDFQSQAIASSFATAQTQTVWFDPSTSGTYYVDVSDASTIGGYSVSATTVSADYTDNASTTGTVTINGSATDGTLSQAGQHDWLAINLTADQAYLFTVTGLTNDASIAVGSADVLSGEGDFQSQAIASSFATAQTQTVWFDPSTSGTYYVDVSDASTIGGYNVSATTVSADYTDNASTTGTVTINGSATDGTLSQTGQHDWLKVTLNANQAYLFTVTGLTNDASIAVGSADVLSGEGDFQSQAIASSFATAQTQTVWFDPSTSGTYYVDVSDASTIGGYNVSATTVSADYTDNASTTGTVTINGSATDGTLSQAGQHDWLAINLTADQAYLFTVTGLTNDASIAVGSVDVLSGEGDFQSQAIASPFATAQTQTVWFDPSTSGTYYVDVSDASTIGDYTVSAKTVSADYTDNTSTTGTVTINGSATDGTLSQAGQHDWLKVTLNANQAYLFTVTGLTNDASIAVGSADVLSGEGDFQSQAIASSFATTQTQTVWFDPSTSGTYYVDVSDASTIGDYTVSAKTVSADYTDTTTTTGLVVLCFLRGTRIATPDGEVPVEQLAVGDLVQAQFSGLAPVRWIGRRRVDCRRHPNPQQVWPVRVCAGAFGDDKPHRDLWLSPDHAVFVDGVLIPIKRLINGTTIEQAPMDEVTYYHVELPSHDVLLAEGLPAESSLDTGDRCNFENGGGPRRLFADFSVRMWEAFGCAPLVVTGPELQVVRQRLNALVASAAVFSAPLRARATPAA